jgi:hypothetical protein
VSSATPPGETPAPAPAFEARFRHWPLALMLLCIALLLGVLVQPYMRDEGPASIFVTSYDWHTFFFPRFTTGSQELLSGRWPLWNAYEYAGLPLLATAQPAVFYPPKILLFGLLPAKAAYWSFLSLHYVLCAWGFLLFARAQRLSRLSAFVGSAIWVFSLAVVGSNYHPNRIANFCWMPFCFFFATRLVDRATLRDFIGLVLIVTLQTSAGYPEFVLDTLILVGLYMLCRRVLIAREQKLWQSWTLLAAAAALGLLIACAQLVPLAEVARVADRARLAKLTSSVVTQLTAPASPYWPPALLTVMLLGLSGRRGWVPAVQVAFCAFIVGGGWLLLRRLPGFSVMRFPYGWWMIGAFPCGWLGAAGTEVLLRAGSDPDKRRRLIARVTGLGSLLAIAYSAHRALTLDVQRKMEIITNLPSALLAVLGSGLLLAVAVALYRGRLRPGLLFAALFTLVISHLSSYPFGYYPAAIERPAPHGKVKSLLAGRALKGRTLSLYDLQYGYNHTDRMPSIFGAEESFLPWNHRQLGKAFSISLPLRYIDWPVLVAARGFLNAMNLEYIVATPQELAVLANGGFDVLRVAGPEKDLLFSNPQRMGTAWVNYTVRVIEDPEALRQYVLGPHFDPHREVVLEKPPKGRYPGPNAHRASAIRAERRPSPTELELDVDLQRPGVLVVSESEYPGWETQVNGRKVETVRVNYILRGVELPAGSHRVRFVYRPEGFRTGLALSGVGLVSVALLAGVALWRRRAQPRRRAA